MAWTLLSAVVGAALVLAAQTYVLRSPTATLGASPSSWLQWGFAANHEAVFGVGGMAQDWTFNAKAAVADQVSVVNGIVFAGTNGNQVFAIKDGRQLWQTTLPNQIMATPLVDDGVVIAGVGNKLFPVAHPDGKGTRGTKTSGIWALSARTGQVIWSYRTPGEDMPTPAISHGVVYELSGDRHLYALDVQTGRLLYSLNLGSYASMASPVIAGNMLYVGGAYPYGVFAINLSTHKLAWKHIFPKVTSGLDDASAAAAHGLIYTEGTRQQGAALHEYLFALSQKTGQLAWQVDLGSGYSPPDKMRVGNPTVVGSTLYTDSPVTQAVTAINARTGQVLWKRNLGAQIRTTPVVAYGRVLVADSSGYVTALNAQNGTVTGAIELASPPPTGGNQGLYPKAFGASSPVIVGNTLFIGGMNGEVFARPISQLGL